MRVVGLINDQSPTTWRGRHKVSMVHRDLTAVSQMNDEWLKRLRVVHVANLFDGHGYERLGLESLKYML
jgi:hypothetical protein